MVLTQVLEQLVYTLRQKPMHLQLDEIQIEKITNDSREVIQDSVFVCIRGAEVDGHRYVEEVISQGASVIVIEKARGEDVALLLGTVFDNMDESSLSRITVIEVEDTRYALAHMSASYYGNPARDLRVIGITGTKGKTTATYLVKSILEKAGYKVGLIGTIEVIIGDKIIAAHNTTPESVKIQEYFREMVDAGCHMVVMEVSSQGLMLQRTAGIEFEIGVFTNLSPDHIGMNEHRDFQEYLDSKALLFQQCKLGIGNIDDLHFNEIFRGATCAIETYGLSSVADIRGEQVELINEEGSLGIRFRVSGLMECLVASNLLGIFSIYNILTAMAVCRHFQVPIEVIQNALEDVKVRGRIEKVEMPDAFTVLIDYAHNAMSLESLLVTLRAYGPRRLICLFGCGGNRAKSRRYEMGEVSGHLADITIITSDNPRHEDPQEIIEDIKKGIEKTRGVYVEFVERKEGIRYAIEQGQPGDVIVIAGKGHEDYQEIKGEKYPMDDRRIIADILSEK